MALKCSVWLCIGKLGKVWFHCLAAFICMDSGPHYRKDNRPLFALNVAMQTESQCCCRIHIPGVVLSQLSQCHIVGAFHFFFFFCLSLFFFCCNSVIINSNTKFIMDFREFKWRNIWTIIVLASVWEMLDSIPYRSFRYLKVSFWSMTTQEIKNTPSTVLPNLYGPLVAKI